MTKQRLSLNKVQYMNQWTIHYISSQKPAVLSLQSQRTLKGWQVIWSKVPQVPLQDALQRHAVLVKVFDKVKMTQDGNTQPTTVYTLFVGEGATKEDEVSGGNPESM